MTSSARASASTHPREANNLINRSLIRLKMRPASSRSELSQVSSFSNSSGVGERSLFIRNVTSKHQKCGPKPLQQLPSAHTEMYPENEIESGKLEFQAEPRKVDLPPNPGRRRYVIARKS